MADFCTTNIGEQEVENPCNGEIIKFNLRVQLCSNTITNPSGKIQIHVHQVLTGRGKGDIGNEYIANNAATLIINAKTHENGEVSGEQTTIFNTNIIGKGSAPNFILRMRMHFVVTPNGDIIVDRDIVEAVCK